MNRRLLPAALVVSLASTLVACGSSGSSSTGPVTITLIAYDSFPAKGTSLNTALDAFTKQTGITVKIANSDDAGTMVTKAKLTAGNPEGDVMWGVDNTLLSAAVDAKIFSAYKAAGLGKVPQPMKALVPDGELTPVDYGDVCVNYDIKWFADKKITPPTTLADLTKPEYKNLLVVEDPTASSTGLAFLLATIAASGDSGWHKYWADLRSNGVAVESSWTTAYEQRFSASGGDRPLVVSYGSSPPADIVYSDPPRTTPITGVSAGTCFRQIEFAGVLRGTKHQAAARKLVDFLLSPQLQAELPLNIFVYPARTDVPLPEVFTKFAVVPSDPYTIAPADIAKNREAWQDEWTQIVVR